MLCAFAFNFHGVFDFVQKAPKNYGYAIVSVAKFIGISSSGLGGYVVIFTSRTFVSG